MSTKEILRETYNTVERTSGVSPIRNFRQMLVNDYAFDMYVEGLAESLRTPEDKDSFRILAENTRINLLENSMYNINPYESLTMPILRVFYPKIVAKEAVTVAPMDKPEVIKAFLRASFTQSTGSTYYNAPVTSVDISKGPSIGSPVTATIPVPSNAYDVLDLANITSTDAHLQRDFRITGISADATNFTAVDVEPAVEGHFSFTATIDSTSDIVSGKVDYLAGTVSVSSTSSYITAIRFTVTCSLEENKINPTTRLVVEKVRLNAVDRQISTEWTINMEQDLKALFDVSVQAEMVNIMGQQVALDIDNELVSSLILANSTFNGVSHTGTFTRSAPITFTWGNKLWHENIIPPLNQLSAKIYTDTNMDAGNTLLCNPYDAAILEDINSFNYTGTSSADGELGYHTATVSGGKWRILTSAIVPEGTMIMTYKPSEELKVVFYYAPYVPAVLHPYPLGPIPSLTILTRYATALVRPAGIAVLTVS